MPSKSKIKREFIIPDEESILDFFNFNFYGITHLTSYAYSSIFQAIIIGQIAKLFGEEWLYKLHNIHLKFYPISNADNRLSDGEKLYEKITGFKFTKTDVI